jgi:hypothetical protein
VAGESAEAAVAGDQQIRVMGSIDQRRCRHVRRQFGADLQGRRGGSGPLGRSRQDLFGGMLETGVGWAHRRWSHQFVGQRPLERVHDPQRTVPDDGLPDGPVQGTQAG